MKIVICPGHYPERPGAVNKKHGLNEHQEATKVVHELHKLLETSGHEVFIRTGRLSYKVREINRLRPDLALDIHFNADADHLDPEDLNDDRGTGCMVMFCPKAKSYEDPEPPSERQKQASTMSEIISNTLGVKDHGARPGWYWGSLDSKGYPKKKDYFLTHTICPAFIPEPLYIDNNRDCEEWLLSNKHDVIARGISEAIETIKGEL